MTSFFSHIKAHTAFYLGSILVIFFLLGHFFPESFWATHDNRFLPGILQFILWAIILICLGLAYFDDKKELRIRNGQQLLASPHLMIGLVILVSGILFYSFPIFDDYYGDARVFRSFLHKPILQLPEGFGERFFSFSLQPEHGRKGVRLLVTGLAYLTGSSTYEAFRWMGICCGMGFIAVWLYSVRYFIQNNSWRVLLALLGLSTPMMLIFFGHVENYSLVYLLLLSWLLLFLSQLKNGNKTLFFALVVLLFVFARLHIMMLLCLPGLILGGFHTFFPNKTITQNLLTMKGMLLWVLLPLLVIGLLLYVFVFEDHRDPRVMQNFTDIERLFLPIFSPAPPFDRYNLLSAHHLLDFFNACLLWSPAGLFLIGWVSTQVPVKEWNKDSIWAILGLTFFLFFATFFMINPLFSMPMEWDLMCFPASIFLVGILYLISQTQQIDVPRSLLFIVCAMGLFTASSIYVNHQAKPLSQKIETMGRHVFKTYYAHSSSYLLFALNVDSEHYSTRKESILRDLEPHALPGKDKEYANLLMDEAMMFFNNKDREAALMMIGESIRYYPPIAGTFQEFIQVVEQAKP